MNAHCVDEVDRAILAAARRRPRLARSFLLILPLLLFSPGLVAGQGECIDYVPEVLGSTNTAAVEEIAIRGGYVYMAAGASGLLVYSISSTPTLVGSASIPYAYGITITGSTALVTTSTHLWVVDISSPTSPAIRGSVELSGGGNGIAVSQPTPDYAYVSVATLDGPRGFEVVDIRNPSSPTVVGFRSSFYVPYDIVVRGNYAFVGQVASGLRVIDVSIPTNPALLTTFNPTSDGYTHLAYSPDFGLEDYVFASPGLPNRIDVIDVSNPASPSIVGTLASGFEEMDIANGILYAGGMTSLSNTGLQVIDVSNPTSPVIATTLTLPYWPRDVEASGGIACLPVSGSENSLQIVSITPPVGVIGGMTPPSGTTCVPTSGTLLQWSPDSNATSYEVQLGTSCGTGTISSTATAQFSTPVLSPQQTYYWRVRGQNVCGGYGTWSPCQDFTTAPLPLPAPSLLAPANGATDVSTSVTLQWSPVAGASQYEVQIGTSCGAGAWTAVGTNEYAAAGLTKGETYHWRARGIDGCGLSGAAASCFSFTVIGFNTPEGQNVVVEPTPGVTMEFDEVTQAGDTTVDVSTENPGPDVPGYMFQGDYYDIETTAQHEGNIEICLEYDDTGMTLSEEFDLRLFHLVGGVWIDITTGIDVNDDVICGTVTSLSPFGVAMFQPWIADGTSPIVEDTRDAVGVSWADYDGDGDPDLYVTNHMQPDRLFRNDGSGVFVDATVSPLGHSGQGSHACWGDFDEDGDPDLYLTVRAAANVLYRNDGGSFVDVTAAPLDDANESQGAAWADYDGDGDLDLYVANYGQANRLYRNDGDGAFVDVTAAPLDDTGLGTGVAWADYDDDGDQDLYLANTGSTPNRLFENLGNGSFVDATPTAMADTGEGRGLAWGDYDNDGDLDLYLSNGDGANRLFRNDGGGTFVNVAGGFLADAAAGRGVAWADFDNDGDLDLYLANLDAPNRLVENLGGGAFTDATVSPLDDPGWGIGCGWADYDGDGDLDLYLANAFGPNRLMRNDQILGHHWLHLDLVGAVSNRSAVGARVELWAGGQRQIREVRCGSGYLSQDSRTLEFGLGSQATVDSLVVRWPSGIVNHYVQGIGIDRVLTVGESQGGATDVAPMPNHPDVTRLHDPAPNPFNPRTVVRFDIARATPVEITVYDIAGRRVRALVDGGRYEPGRHRVIWDGKDQRGRTVASGVYHVRLNTREGVQTKRVALVR